MKIVSYLVAATCAVASVYAQEAPAPAPATAEAEAVTAPSPTSAAPSTSTTTTTTTTTTVAPEKGDGSANKNTASLVTKLKARPVKGEYHMEPIRVVQARVQSDAPMLVKGRFVSSFGKGDLNNGYTSALDTVNTASVEGALMYVQAEGINIRARSKDDRCYRKYGMKYVVFYEMLIAQTNETIAQFQNTWNAPEYGPMIPMDGGRCTPLANKDGKDVLPVECYQFNGELGQPNLGPFIGGGLKDDDVRAPYPETYWFSFPNTCPTTMWKEKTYESDCRKNSRKGLCDIDKAPDGVECTFAYDILGWVPLDDLVGITSTLNNQTNKLFNNFTEWCSLDENNVEFAAKPDGTMEAGLTFWKDPLNKDANKDRSDALIQLYSDILNGDFVSRQIDQKDVQFFKTLTSPADLEAKNPKCFKTVATCNSGNGCKRQGYSQICKPCTSEKCPTDATFKFPTLAKAPTSLSPEETTSGALLDALTPVGGKNRTSAPTGKKSSAVSMAPIAMVSLCVAVFMAIVM